MTFKDTFGGEPTVTEKAHGRVNLIGEHTDYNGGFVLPMSLPQATYVCLRPRTDNFVRVSSRNITELNSTTEPELVEFRLQEEKASGHWGDYIQGVSYICHKTGNKIGGFDAYIESEVPIGSGVSSSAALEVALFKAIRSAFNLQMTDIEIAKLSQRVENEFVGARVGIMDPLAAGLLHSNEALFVDTQSLEVKRIPLPLDMGVIVINSGISHRNVGGSYNERRSQCEQAASQLGVQSLRELGLDDLNRMSELPEVLYRRARHVVTENVRVLEAVEALKANDLTKLGRLFELSHASMRDDYEVSIPEIDKMVEIALNESKVYGARLTGGGFGGSVVIITDTKNREEMAEKIAASYFESVKVKPTVLVPSKSTGLSAKYPKIMQQGQLTEQNAF